MKKYKIGYVQGTFDMFHVGHLLLIKRAAAQCEQLMVGVVSDEFNFHNKKRMPCIPYEDRAAIVAAIRDVAKVIKIERGEGVIDTWRRHHYDCYFSGDDHLGNDFLKDMERHGIATVLFPYTKRVSSSKLRKHSSDSADGVYQKPKEILFLPYKAAMWDSMESVWQAVCKDENCNAVVVPIPYAELDEERNVREWKWDGEVFPANVPVVDWRDYDIKEHHPDVIYIHNPYDDGNRITMVEPRFFSRNLRKHTDTLVYIPYFAWTGIWPANHLGLPCYEHVDKIIVQSPYYRTWGDGGTYESDNKLLSEVLPSRKMQALGSPKLDRMAALGEKIVVPEEWQVKIGEHKSVFLNATVAPLLSYGRRWMDKLWQTYHTIRKHRDVSVIFRPHPLMLTMMESKYPEFIGEYEKWEKDMAALSQVIIDDSPDLERAVAAADAYMGEVSSVVQLFALQGKPIFLHDMLLGEAEDGAECNLAASAMLVDGDMIYFWAEYWNMLCAYHISKDEVEVLYQEQPSVFAFFNFSGMVKVAGHLILVPNCSPYILDYDLVSGKVVKVPYEKPLLQFNFGHALLRGDKVLLFGSRNPRIMEYDVRQKKAVCRLDVPKEILDNRTDVHDQLLGKPCCLDGAIYIPIVNANQVMEWHPDTNKYHIHRVGHQDAAYGFAAEHAGNIWLAPWLGGPITVWHPPTGIVKSFDQFPHNFKFTNMPGVTDTFFFIDTLKCGHYWYLLPYCSNMILRVDFNTGTLAEVELGFVLDKAMVKHYQQMQNVWGGTVQEDKVLIWTGADRKIHCLDGNSSEVEAVYAPHISEADGRKYRHELKNDDFRENPYNGQVAAIYEDGVSCTQQSFLAYVQHGEHDYEGQKAAFARLTPNTDGTCGKKIHQYIMAELARKRGDVNGVE